MELPGVESCQFFSCLKCPYSGVQKTLWKKRSHWKENGDIICQNLRSKYERKKKEFVELMANQSIEGRAAEKEITISKKISVDDIVKLLRENPNRLIMSNQGNIGKASALLVVREIYPSVSERSITNAIGILNQDVLFCSKLSLKKTVPIPETG
jgi:hypothetical protein